ncbi:MAG: T9SS type A sorting domain-containing protein [Chitinophagales bacterium]
MKSIKTYILTICFFLPGLSQAQTWQWAVSFGTSNYERGFSLSLHPNGSLYCTGDFASGSFILSDTDVVYGYADYNAFLLQYNLNGNLIKKNIGREAVLNSFPKSIGFGRLLLTENLQDYYSMITVAGDCRIDTTYIDSHLGSSCLAQWGTNTQLINYKPLHATDCNGNNISGTSIVAFSKGKFYGIAPTGSKCTYFDTIRIDNPDSLIFNSSKAVFVKADTAGHFMFAKQVLGGKVTELSAPVVLNDKILFFGESDSCFVFDTIQACSLLGHGIGVLFVTDTNGSVFWSKPVYSNSGIYGVSSYTMDSNNNIYISGTFDSVLYIGNDVFYRQSPAYYGRFMAKFDSDGNLIWYKELYRTSTLQINLCRSNASNKLYTFGNFSGSMALCGDTLTAQSSSDMFIARFDTAGNCLGIVTVPNASVAGLVEDSAGNVYVTGAVYGTNAIAFDETTVMPQGNGDFFLAKLSAITGNTNRLLEDNRLTIYPNPNNQNFTIVVPEALVHGSTAHLSILDNNGRVIKEEDTDISGNRVNTDISTVQKGMYTVILSHGHKKFTGRVVVE